MGFLNSCLERDRIAEIAAIVEFSTKETQRKLKSEYQILWRFSLKEKQRKLKSEYQSPGGSDEK